jgi:hypothetical protein
LDLFDHSIPFTRSHIVPENTPTRYLNSLQGIRTHAYKGFRHSHRGEGVKMKLSDSLRPVPHAGVSKGN